MASIRGCSARNWTPNIARSLLATLLFSGICCAQQPFGAPAASDGVVKQFVRDELNLWSAPAHLHRSDAAWLVKFAVTSAILFKGDRNISEEVSETDDLNHPSHFVSSLGSGIPLFAAPAALLAVGRISQRSGISETGSLGLRAVAHAVLVSQTLKQIAGRERPTSGNGLGRFRSGGSSFPSGHAMSSWAFATVIAIRSHNKWIKVGSYAFAAAVGASRIGGLNHFPSDVLVGSAGGYLIGRYIAHH